MDIFQAVVLALLQGFTEFLPVSSSAHLILPSQILGWADQGLAFDVAVHVGTLVAVMAYFRRELVDMGTGCVTAVTRRSFNHDAQLGLAVMVGVFPAGIIGILCDDFIETYLRSLWVIAITTIGFGLLLWFAHLVGKRSYRGESELDWRYGILIGAAQAIALIPGTSRSGITITAALLLGFSASTSARFSFLLSVPVILAAGGLKTLQLIQSSVTVNWTFISIGAIVACLSAYLTIRWFLSLLERVGMLPFVIYRLFLGIFLIVFLTFTG
ncbi:MAG: undecaprenyl-diphosphate phosphatase [Pseudomonadales bacterium]|nr:undecaprenyl-diphosphate phosphatase [Pseudomonadales bacterium]